MLNEQIRFTDIAVIIEKTMQAVEMQTADNLATILTVDKHARHTAIQFISELMPQ